MRRKSRSRPSEVRSLLQFATYFTTCNRHLPSFRWRCCLGCLVRDRTCPSFYWCSPPCVYLRDGRRLPWCSLGGVWGLAALKHSNELLRSFLTGARDRYFCFHTRGDRYRGRDVGRVLCRVAIPRRVTAGSMLASLIMPLAVLPTSVVYPRLVARSSYLEKEAAKLAISLQPYFRSRRITDSVLLSSPKSAGVGIQDLS
jgi:hypothetical protein